MRGSLPCQNPWCCPSKSPFPWNVSFSFSSWPHLTEVRGKGKGKGKTNRRDGGPNRKAHKKREKHRKRRDLLGRDHISSTHVERGAQSLARAAGKPRRSFLATTRSLRWARVRRFLRWSVCLAPSLGCFLTKEGSSRIFLWAFL